LLWAGLALSHLLFGAAPTRRSGLEVQVKRLICISWSLTVSTLSPLTARGNSTLYATNATIERNELYILSTDDASATFVGPFGVGGYMAGLAYDTSDAILFGSTTGKDNLYSIDPSTAGVTFIGPLGVRLVHSLAFDNTSGTLYGAGQPDSSLYQIDPITGTTTLIGPIGFNSVSGMTFEPQSNTLYGITDGPSATSRLITIDPSSGQGSLVADIPDAHSFQGISFDPDSGILYGIDNGGATSLIPGLYTIDVTTGTATLVGQVSLDNPLDLQFIPDD
jgi:hypothetical protein